MSEYKETISVIIPAYNAQETLEETVSSVVAQKNEEYELEIVIVNDGSTDMTEQIASRLSEKNTCVKTYLKTNGGVSAARNYGLERACGEYIVFVDSDDMLPEDAILTLYRHICDTDADMVCGGYDILRDGVRSAGFMPQTLVIENEKKIVQAIAELEIKCSTLAGSPWGKIYRKSIISDKNIFFPQDTCFGEDFFFCADYYKACDKIVYIQEIVYIYNIRQGSLVNSVSGKSAEMFTMLHEKKFEYYKESQETVYYVNTMYVEQMVACAASIARKQEPVKDKLEYVKDIVMNPHFQSVILREDYAKRSRYVELMVGLCRKKRVGLIYTIAKVKETLRKGMLLKQ